MIRTAGRSHDGALGGSHARAWALLQTPPSACRRSIDQTRRRKSRQKLGE